MDYAGRIASTGVMLADASVDALLITNLANVRYLSGFSGTNGQMLVTSSGATFLTDPRYSARAADLVSDSDVVVYPAHLAETLTQHLTGIRRLGVEAASMTLAARDDLAERLGEVELVPTKNIVEGLRRTKDADEVALIKRAVDVADEAYRWVLDRLVPGVIEREVALDLEMRMRLSGADEVSFPPIVGSGPLSAHIHHTPGERPLEKGDLVLMDFGARVEGYCSDMTRTVSLGVAMDEHIELYGTVLAAQQAAIAAVSAGAETAYVDRVARRVIEDAGQGDRFAHGLGHGVGLDIHEAPTLKKVTDDKLLAGDVVTIEPGIYVAERGGIRIEDCVLVTDAGCEVLCKSPKEELIQL